MKDTMYSRRKYVQICLIMCLCLTTGVGLAALALCLFAHGHNNLSGLSAIAAFLASFLGLLLVNDLRHSEIEKPR